MNPRLFAAFVLCASACSGQYVYDYSSNPVVADSARWQANGSYSFGSGGVTFPGSGGGSLIDLPAIPGNANDYEVNATLAIKSGGGTYIEFLRAGSAAVQAGTGSYVSVELVVATGFQSPGAAILNINQCVSGSTMTIASPSVTATDGMSLRSVIWSGNLWVFINNVQVWAGQVTQTAGNPGIGGYSIPAGSGFAGIQLGHHDTMAPQSPFRPSFASSIFPNQVSMLWRATADDPAGVGVWQYSLSRADPVTGLFSLIGSSDIPTIVDNAVQPATTYNYKLTATDYHGNVSLPLNFSATTPPAQAVDPRRIGVRKTGAYWGGGGEQIDMLSGNLNFSLPLIQAQGRTGWTLPVGLVYNSQNYRTDNGVQWKLYGTSAGIGFGWHIQIGAITPYYANWSSGPDHYIFLDSSGTEYRLNVNANGVWSSAESIYVWFDANSNILHFRDGTRWIMGCTSGGTEFDAGTLHPTAIEDSNGNQVLVTYLAGAGMPAGAFNTSAAIASIEDVRGKGSPSYTFVYASGTSGNLVSITNSVQTSETYTFGHSNCCLTSVTEPTGASWLFTYDTGAYGELSQVTFPDGGHIRWVHADATYNGGRVIREVVSRYVANSASATEWGPYTFSHDDSANPNPTIHANTTMLDASGVGAKTWKFTLPDGNPNDAWKVGLLSDFLQTASAGGAVLTHDTNMWALNGSQNPYVSGKTTVLDEGTSGVKTTTSSFVVDSYGNGTQQTIHDYSGALVRTYTNTYLTSSNYVNAYVLNRLTSSTVVDSQNNSVNLATNTYDAGTLAAVSGTPTEFDSVLGSASNHIRGNVTQAVTPGSMVSYTYDVTGHALTGADATGTGSSATYTITTNFGAPDAAAPISGTADVQNGHSATQASGSQLSTGYNYNTALSLVQSTMPNSATTKQNFDATTGLLTSSVSVHGATTYYTYTFNPTSVTATTNGHWSKAYKDGFGRDIAVESGYGTTIVSHVDTVYGPCACSPLGKVVKTSLPYAISAGGQITASDGTANIAWNNYTYDGLGRTVTQKAPDGSPTGYVYLGNTTKVTDPAGNWKRYTNDVLGNLVEVDEPNPQYGQMDSVMTNFVTNYTYDVEGHLTQVQMPRGGYTQTRTFNYDLPTGRLMSVTNPESGTVNYTYYSSGRLMSKTDAKGQKVVYSYDGYGRMAYIDRFPDGTTWDPCQSVALTYDSSQAGSYALGRLYQAATGAYWAQGTGDISTCGGTSVTEIYTYTPGGLVTYKGYSETRPVDANPLYFATSAVGGSYAWDNEGHMTGYGSFTYTLDAMGRPTSLTENGPGTVWVQNAAYGPGGEIRTMQYRTSAGSYYTENHTFNNRSQLIQLQASATGLTGINLQYVYPTGSNNGQVSQMIDVLSGEQITYVYDSLKRLITAQTTQSHTQYPNAPWWGQSFGYDGFGNLQAKTPVGPGNATNMSLSIDPTKNQITTQGFSYDANGNMTSMAATPQNVNLSYDVENRTGGGWFDLQNQPLSRAGQWNLYGLHGERMETDTFGWQPIVINGQLVGTYGTQTRTSRNIYFGGRLIQSNGITVLTDRLGSVRANESGETFEYFPYGEEIIVRNPQDREKFATYTRDAITGLDYGNQRYYASAYGRFNTPDRYQAKSDGTNDPTQPQSWNRYAYVTGDPVSLVDPNGTCGGPPLSGVRADGTIYVSVAIPCSADDGLLGIPWLSGPTRQLAKLDYDDSHNALLPTCPGVPNAPGGLDGGQIEKNIADAQQYLSNALVNDPEGTGFYQFLGYLTAQFAPKGAWDYKSNPQYGPSARDFGNFNFGAVLASTGASYYQTQNAAGIAQIGICRIGGGACGTGVPGFVFPYGDQATDAAQIKRGWTYENKVISGCRP